MTTVPLDLDDELMVFVEGAAGRLGVSVPEYVAGLVADARAAAEPAGVDPEFLSQARRESGLVYREWARGGRPETGAVPWDQVFP